MFAIRFDMEICVCHIPSEKKRAEMKVERGNLHCTGNCIVVYLLCKLFVDFRKMVITRVKDTCVCWDH